MRRPPILQVLVLVVAAAQAACSDDDSDPGSGDGADRSLFVDGCPTPGRSVARRIDRDDLGPTGPEVLAQRGDYLLMNDRAAFVVSSPDDVDAWWYYGGILVDAVALEGCAQAGPERYQELAILVAQADLAAILRDLEDLSDLDLSLANIRGVRPETVEVAADGAGGEPAVIRARGPDDFFWLVDYTLARVALEAGRPKGLGPALGLDVTIDYSLAPGSSILEIAVTYRNTRPEPQTAIPAVAILSGSTTDVDAYALGPIDVGGFGLDLGVPWLTGASAERNGAWSFAMQDALLTTTNISGVDVALDALKALLPLRLGAAGSPDDAATVRYAMAVGPTDANSAERTLRAFENEPFPGTTYELRAVAGTVLERGSGAPVEGAEIEVEAQTLLGDTVATLHRFQTDARGRFAGELADFGGQIGYRYRTRAEGRAEPAPLEFTARSIPAEVTIEVGPAGALAYDIRDDEGRSLPARITLWQDGSQKHRYFAAPGEGTAPAVPGSYEISVTRGYEYATFHGSVTVAENVPTPFSAVLEHVVDTTGFLSMDGHIHSAPSPDSKVPVPDRIRGAASEGLEIPVPTDHEFVGSYDAGVEETGLGDWVQSATGSELTASVPEHINLYGIEPRFELDDRGGYIRWYGDDVATIYAAAREGGASVVSLNHPRSYMNLIQWDRILGDATLEDPTHLGLAPDARLWSWNFDVWEMTGGHDDVFARPDRPTETGNFDDWMSFLNHGHPITAVAVTDVHGFDVPGAPRTYFASSTDDPAEFDEDELVEAMLRGRAVLSDGAFARVRINDEAGLGDMVTDTDGTVDLAIHVEAIPEIDVTRVLVFANCDEVADVETTDPDGVVKLDTTLEIPIDRDAHVVTVGFGEGRFPRGLDSFDPTRVPRFVTNAIYVDRDGDDLWTPPGGKSCSYTLP